MTDIPPEIGPHEGRELELMLADKKPAAMFSDVVPASYEMPEKDFEPYVRSGRILKREEIYDFPSLLRPLRFLYYALPNDEWRVALIHLINTAIFSGSGRSTNGDDETIGRLLGYTDYQISAYLEWKENALLLKNQR